MDQLQVREAHLSSDKVSADQTSDNINAKDNTMSPNWHLWRSRHLEKATRCCQAKRLISFVHSAWFRPILDYLWRKSKSDCFRRSHLTSDKVNADQDICEGQCWGQQLISRNIDLSEGQGWTSKKTHGAFKLDFWKTPPDSVMDFRLTFEEGQARLFEKVTFYTWQSQCRSRYQRKSKHLEKVTRCSHAWPLQDLSLRLISLVRFRSDSRLTLKKVKSDCFRRSLPIRTSEKINAKDNISPFWALRMSGLNLEKDTVLSSWTSGRPPDSVMDFRLTFGEGQARLFEKVTSYPWQSQCRPGHQRRSRHLEKAARCFHAWPLQDLSLRLISLVRFRRDSRMTLKKVKSDCFRRSLPIRTSENINAKDNISPFWALRMSGLNLEKDTVLSSWTSGRPPDSVMDFRLTLEKVKRDCLRRLHLTSDKVNADQDIREGQCWG